MEKFGKIEVKAILSTNNKKNLEDFIGFGLDKKRLGIGILRKTVSYEENSIRYKGSYVDFFTIDADARILGLPVVYKPNIKVRLCKFIYKKIPKLLKENIFKDLSQYDIYYIFDIDFKLAFRCVSEGLDYSYEISFDGKMVTHFRIPTIIFDKF